MKNTRRERVVPMLWGINRSIQKPYYFNIHLNVKQEV